MCTSSSTLVPHETWQGPLFVKYNSVLRGLDGKVPYLVQQMVRLCCHEPEQLEPCVERVEQSNSEARKEVITQQILPTLNRYTTTLHAINSAIIKLSKLTYADKVYRGISGMGLPREFWKPNSFGVMGGIEGGFMSTTKKKSVAVSYAMSKGKGLVFEVQQGMIDRGADVGNLSQYPHEKEMCARAPTAHTRTVLRDLHVELFAVGCYAHLSTHTQCVALRKSSPAEWALP